MSAEAKSMRWIGAVFAAAFLTVIAVVIFNVRSRREATPPSPSSVANKSLGAGSSSQAGAAAQIPKLVPGETCEKAVELYGAPNEKDQFVQTWRTRDYTVYASRNSECLLTSIEVAVEPGHKAITEDGITLGKDTLADAKRILKPRFSDSSESVDAPEGNWEGLITLGPASTAQYTVIYRAKFDSKKADQLRRDPNFDDIQGQIVTGYSLELAAPVQPTK
jgi:hypothetical protein